MTVQEMVDDILDGGDDLSVWIDGRLAKYELLPPEQWSSHVVVGTGTRVLINPAGGGGSRTIFATIAMILVAVAAPYLAGVVFGAGTPLALIAGATLSFAGTVAIGKLFPPEQNRPDQQQEDQARNQFSDVDSDVNLLTRGAFPPIVVDRRILPPEAAQPRLYLENGRQMIDRVFVLTGHHSIQDIRIDGASVDTITAVTTEIKSGIVTESNSGMIQKIADTNTTNHTLSTFGLSTDGLYLEDQVTPQNSDPVPFRLLATGHPQMEEITLRFRIGSLVKTDNPTANVRVPVRIRLRRVGTSDWRHLPEWHLLGAMSETSLVEVILRWDDSFRGTYAQSGIRHQFFHTVPAVTGGVTSDGSTGVQWSAHSSFVLDAGIRTAVRNCSYNTDGPLFHLSDSTAFPRTGDYEIEIVRGAAMLETDLNISSYTMTSGTLSGLVPTFFKGFFLTAGALWQVPVAQSGFMTEMLLTHATTLVSLDPVNRPGFAAIHMRSRDQSNRNVSVHASKYVYDWNGSSWSTLTTSTNPATHAYNVIREYLLVHDMDLSLIDSAAFVAWRQECVTKGYKLSTVFTGQQLGTAMAEICQAGFARPVFSDKFSVDWFRDRSAELPVQIFTPKNSKTSFARGFPEQVSGYRIKFHDEADNYKETEIQVNNPFVVNLANYTEVTMNSIANAALVRRRGVFDLLQETERSVEWSIETGLDGYVCQVGDLVGIVTDLVGDRVSSARVVRQNGPLTLSIDQVFEVRGEGQGFFDVANMFVETNVLELAYGTVVLVHTTEGLEMAHVQNVVGQTLVLAEPLAGTAEPGTLLSIGPVEAMIVRGFVTAIERKAGGRATISVVDEAPQIYDKMQEMFG